MRIRSILATGALATVAVVSLGSAAGAATIDGAGKGFVGKGEVQSAFGWNNATAQKYQNDVTFSAEQATSQTLDQSISQAGYRVGAQQGTQHATQSATQSSTQVVGQDLTCEFTNGNGTQTFHRDGVRDGVRIGVREGTRDGERPATRLFERLGERTGTQSGVQSGSLKADLNAENKKTGQYTGWFLHGFESEPAYAEAGGPVWGEPTFGEYTFDAPQYRDWLFLGDFTFGEFTPTGDYAFQDLSGTEWDEWDAESGENPADCLRSQNADKISLISNVITPGEITDGEVTGDETTIGETTAGAVIGEYDVPQPIKYGAITAGTVLNDGPAKVFATFGDVTKPLA